MLKRGMRNIHPGEILKEEILNANELTVTAAAKLLNVCTIRLSLSVPYKFYRFDKANKYCCLAK